MLIWTNIAMKISLGEKGGAQNCVGPYLKGVIQKR
jgi:hypothetical protein